MMPPDCKTWKPVMTSMAGHIDTDCQRWFAKDGRDIYTHCPWRSGKRFPGGLLTYQPSGHLELVLIDVV